MSAFDEAWSRLTGRKVEPVEAKPRPEVSEEEQYRAESEQRAAAAIFASMNRKLHGSRNPEPDRNYDPLAWADGGFDPHEWGAR